MMNMLKKEEEKVEMDLSIQTFLIVCPLVFVAGFVDSIAGGGGLISLPAYLLAGVPIHSALGTNKMSSMIGTGVSTYRYCKSGFVNYTFAIPSIIAALLGSATGANLALYVSDTILKMVLLVVLPIVSIYVIKNKSFEKKWDRELSKKQVVLIGTVSAFFIGCYDGFYGPGTGTFLLICFTAILGMDVKEASGNVKLVNLSSNIAAFITFILSGKVVVILGATASFFSILGHYIGSGMVMKNGAKIVRPIILIVMVLLYIKIISQLIG